MRPIMAVLVAAVCHASADAQVITNGQNPLDNAAAAGARAPGDMVGAGLAQAFIIHDDARAGPDITETERPTSVRAQALADSIAILFEQLNQAIVAFHNLLLLRGGSSPSVSGLPSMPGVGSTDLQPGGRRKASRRVAPSSRPVKPQLSF